MKITLDTAALNRLIGGNTAVEMELRTAVVQDFARRHLKAITETDIIKNTLRDIKAECIRAAEAAFGEMKYEYNGTRFHLQQKVRDAVVQEANNQVVSITIEIVKSHIESNREKIETQIQERVDRLTAEMIHAEVRKRVQAKFDAISKAAASA